MFDTTQEIIIPIQNREAPGGKKTARVRFPTNQQWAEWSNGLRFETSRRPGGLGTKTEVIGREKATQVLYRSILIEESMELDTDEQEEVIERISENQAVDVALDGSVLVVEMRVLGTVMTKHYLNLPTAREQKAYQRALPDTVDHGRGRTSLSMSDAAQVNYYDQLVVRTAGYAANAVPNPHKVSVVSVLRELLEAMQHDPDFRPTVKA